MVRKIAIFLIGAALVTGEANPLAGFDFSRTNIQLSLAPIILRIPQKLAARIASPLSPIKVMIEAVGPDGSAHPVRDTGGNSSWSIESGSSVPMRVLPDAASYAGPLRIRLNDHIILPFDPSQPLKDFVLEKILSVRQPDGMVFRVHFTDFSLQKARDPSYPYRVLMTAQRAYDILMDALGNRSLLHDGYRAIDFYLGEADGTDWGIGGFGPEDFKRAPLFLMKADGAAKTPAILLPADYRKFLKLWNQFNRVPLDPDRNPDIDLAGSIIHEMTHALLHAHHENLGSTEYQIRNGDWYTEGLARYYELKIGSYSGFVSEGFRRRTGERIEFSRGGANYYLRFPDESFFGLRYENALFWLYFERRFGAEKILDMTRGLREVAHGADTGAYVQLIEGVTGVVFGELLDDYFNWIYRGEYRRTREGRSLGPVAVTRSAWKRGRLLMISGSDPRRAYEINTDPVSVPGRTAVLPGEIQAGDWTSEADVKPMAFDAHELRLDRGSELKSITVRNLGNHSDFRVTFYIRGRNGTEVIKRSASSRHELFLSGDFGGITRIGIVISNLGSGEAGRYEIDAR